MAHIEPHVERCNKEEKKKRKIKKIHGDDKLLRGKWGEVSPTLINSVEGKIKRRNRKVGEEKKKEKRKMKEKIKKRENEKMRWEQT